MILKIEIGKLLYFFCQLFLHHSLILRTVGIINQYELKGVLPNNENFQPYYSRISSILGFKYSFVNLDLVNAENQKTGVNYLRETLCRFI